MYVFAPLLTWAGIDRASTSGGPDPVSLICSRLSVVTDILLKVTGIRLDGTLSYDRLDVIN